MSTQESTNLTVQEAQKLLKSFNCIEPKLVNLESEKDQVRQALLLLSEHSDYQIFGICADTTEQGLLALKTYTTAFGYEPNCNFAAVDGAVYLKFNPKTKCYLESYTGIHRGVLVSFQSSEVGDINEMYGHLPLDLFVMN
jgi:Domain of unknown function (DUF1824)